MVVEAMREVNGARRDEVRVVRDAIRGCLKVVRSDGNG